jgi:hypothetical protein
MAIAILFLDYGEEFGDRSLPKADSAIILISLKHYGVSQAAIAEMEVL